MFEKRLRGYRAIGYAKGETPLGYGETGDEVVVEYDEDVLRSLKELHVREMERGPARKTRSKKPQLPRISKTRLKAMIEEATVDCYNESEQVTG
jgi:hypothetical protein